MEKEPEQIPLNFEGENNKEEEVSEKKPPQAERPYKSEEEKLEEIRKRNKGKATKTVEDPFLR